MTTAQENIVGNQDAPDPRLAGRNEPLLVAGQRCDTINGGQLWIATPAKESGPEQEVRMQIPQDAQAREQLVKALSGQSEMARFHLLKNPTDQGYDVLHAEPALSDKQRAVYDENGLAYTWTRELDERVDELFQHAIQARVLALQKKLLDDDKRFGPILTHAREVFVAQMQACGDTRVAAELGRLFDHGIDPSLKAANASYADAMMGRQLTGQGAVERVYYDVRVPLSQQIEVPLVPTVRAAAVANYARQRAVYDHMYASMGQTAQGEDATHPSFLECIEADLVRQRFLHGFHPARTPADSRHLLEEYSGRLISATVQGVICSMGGHAANEDYDWVTPTGETSEPDEHGQPCTLQSHLYDRAYRTGQIVHYADHEKNHGEPNDYLKKLNAAYHDSANEYVAEKETAVAGAMDRAMASGRTRLSDPGKFIKNRLDDLATARKGLISIFEEVETTPPDIF